MSNCLRYQLLKNITIWIICTSKYDGMRVNKRRATEITEKLLMYKSLIFCALTKIKQFFFSQHFAKTLSLQHRHTHIEFQRKMLHLYSIKQSPASSCFRSTLDNACENRKLNKNKFKIFRAKFLIYFHNQICKLLLFYQTLSM